LEHVAGMLAAPKARSILQNANFNPGVDKVELFQIR
jgi:hypothetical protein